MMQGQWLYAVLVTLALPLFLIRLFLRFRAFPQLRGRWREYLGVYSSSRLLTQPSHKSCIWLHAVSVGEAVAAVPLVHALQKAYPTVPLLVTTTTATGALRVQQLFGDTVQHVFAPIDLPWVVQRFFNAFSPKLAIVMETELWPGWLLACAQRKVPILVCNARLSPRSFKRYAATKKLWSGLLNQGVVHVAAQTQADAERFLALGVESQRVSVMGNLKFDAPSVAQLSDFLEDPSRPVWIAASTHPEEEHLVLDAHLQLLKVTPRALLIWVPRHPERFEKIAALVQAAGLPLARRSQKQQVSERVAVYLGDTLGELARLYGSAQVAFVGGSLTPIGGHNPLEALVAGVPVVMGPYVFNFKDMVTDLCQEGLIEQVDSGEQLGQAVAKYWADDSRNAKIQQVQAVLARHRGATEKAMTIIAKNIDSRG